jgi:hypothetical protein
MIGKSCPSATRIAGGQARTARHHTAGHMQILMGRAAGDSEVEGNRQLDTSKNPFAESASF